MIRRFLLPTLAGLVLFALGAQPAAAETPIKVDLGDAHTCVLLAGGNVDCWGRNSNGQLGNGPTAPLSIPISAPDITGATGLTVGGFHSCALLSDGSAKCWGSNFHGQLGNGSTTDSAAPVAVTGLSGATQISAGAWDTCALVNDGAVKCWGRHDLGQLGDDSKINPTQPVSIASTSGGTQVSVGWSHVCELMSAGTVNCWGFNGSGQLGNATKTNSMSPVAVSGLTGATQITTGANHSCAIVSAGAVKCWGDNSSGQLGNNSTTSASAPVSVSGVSGATSIAAGSWHTCALLAAGAVKCWGSNSNGQLGNGTFVNAKVAVAATAISGAVAIQAGGAHSCVILGNASVSCWGRNDSGQIGDGTATTAATPTPAFGLPFTAPPALSGLPTAHTNASGATIFFTSEPGATFSCSVDSAAYAACTSPLALTGLSEGQHTVAVKAIDAASTTSQASTATWNVDLTPPAAPAIDPQQATITKSKTPSIAFTGESGATFSCSVGSGTAYACSSPATFPGPTDGTYTFNVHQIDSAGNSGPSATIQITVDTRAPAAANFASKPAAISSSKSAAFTLGNADSATLACSVDAEAFAPCATNYELSGLSDGRHTLRVTATDLAGNQSQSSWSWLVDSKAPTSLQRIRGVVAKDRRSVSFTLKMAADASGVANVEYSTIKSPAPTALAAPVAKQVVVFATALTIKTQAPVYWLRFKDRAGNWSSWYSAN